MLGLIVECYSIYKDIRIRIQEVDEPYVFRSVIRVLYNAQETLQKANRALL